MGHPFGLSAWAKEHRAAVRRQALRDAWHALIIFGACALAAISDWGF